MKTCSVSIVKFEHIINGWESIPLVRGARPFFSYYFAKVCKSATIYLFKDNNENTTTICEICSKLTINTPRQRHKDTGVTSSTSFWYLHDVVLMSLLLTLNRFYILFWRFCCWLRTNKCRLQKTFEIWSRNLVVHFYVASGWGQMN